MGEPSFVRRRFTVVTLGARHFDVLRSFYNAWGWSETASSTESWVAFEMGSSSPALWPIEFLHEEAAPDREICPSRVWNGITLAVNVPSKDEVHALCELALRWAAESLQIPSIATGVGTP